MKGFYAESGMTGFLLTYLLAFLMLLAGNRDRTDLLDAISASMYWQIKNVTPDLKQLERDAGTDAAPASIEKQIRDLGAGDYATRAKAREELERMGPAILPLLKPALASPDAEVAAVAEELTKKFSDRGQERAIRRLMAIRTLGERKENEALGLLEGLKDSKELFVGEYARRSIAQIKGEKYMPADLTAKLAGDVALLPGDAALVGQSSGLNMERLTLGAMAEAAWANEGATLQRIPGAAAKPDVRGLERKASEELLTLLEKVGNLRMDAVTVGLNYAKDDAGERGWLAVVIRGQFDAALVAPAIREMMGGEAAITPAGKPGDGTMVAEKDGEACVVIPNNEQMIFLTGADKKNVQGARDFMLAALRAGDGKRVDDGDLAALMKTVDTKSPLWLVCRFNAALEKETGQLGIKTVTLETKVVKEGTEFAVQAEMADGDKAKALAETITAGVKSAQDVLKQAAAVTPALKPVQEMLGTVKAEAGGVKGTMTGRLPAGIFNSILGQLPLGEMVRAREEPQTVVEPAGPIELPDRLP